MPGLLALAPAWDCFSSWVPMPSRSRIMDRADAVREVAVACRLPPLSARRRPADRSAIVVLEKPGVDPARGRGRASPPGVVAACRRGRLRFSPHLYNNSDDLERLRAGLASLG